MEAVAGILGHALAIIMNVPTAMTTVENQYLRAEVLDCPCNGDLRVQTYLNAYPVCKVLRA